MILMTYLVELSISLSPRERASSYANSVFTVPVELRCLNILNTGRCLLILLFYSLGSLALPDATSDNRSPSLHSAD